MAKKTIKAQMKQRRDTKANWAATNPVLLDGELGIVSDDPNLYKVGDGATAWNSLPFRGFDGTLAQELGTSPNAVISQKVVSEKLTELESDSFDFSKRIVAITGIGSSAIEGNVRKVGDVFLNTNNGLLRKCVRYNNPTDSSFETATFDKDALYIDLSTNLVYNAINGALVKNIGQSMALSKKKVYRLRAISDSIPDYLLDATNANTASMYDVVYKPTSKKIAIFYILNDNNTNDIPPLYDALYINDEGVAYKWNGVDLVADSTIHQLTIELQHGTFSDKGNIWGATDINRVFGGYNQPLFMKWHSADIIMSVQGVKDDELLEMHCYNENFDYLGKSSTLSPLSNTKYIKFGVIKNDFSLYDNNIRSLDVIIRTSNPEFIKNRRRNDNDGVAFLSYVVEKPSMEYHGVHRTFNNGYIILPPNYVQNGTPTPLIIFCHGTGGYDFNNSTPSNILYYEYLQFLCANGYAVADCSSLANIGFDRINRDSAELTPISLTCYIKLYEYILRNYNIKKDGCYIFGKSAGGLNSTALAFGNQIPIKAVGELAPSFETFTNMRDTNPMWCVNWLESFGIDATSFNQTDWTSAHLEILREHIDNFVGFNPIANNMNGKDWRVLVDKLLSIPFQYGVAESFSELIESNVEVQDIASISTKYQPFPMKIWQAIDDDQVPIATSRLYKKMVENGGGICYLREFPANVGKHHAVDNDPAAPQVTLTTPYGGEKTVPIAYAELVEWFKRW